MSSNNRTLVWLKPQYLGDAVMALPVIDAISASGRSTVVRARSSIRPVLGNRSAIEFLAVEKFGGFRGLARAVRRLRTEAFQEAIILDRSFRSALAVRLAGIRLRSGHDTEGRGFLLTHRTAYDPARNETGCFGDLLVPLQIPIADFRPRIDVAGWPLPPGFEVGALTIGFQPGARYAEKRYPIEALAQVAAAVSARGYAIVALGGPEELESAEEFCNLAGGSVFNRVGRDPLEQTMALVANLRGVAGSDTGLLHVAAAIGTPTVTLFGPNPASKWGHLYPPHRVVEAPGGDLAQIPSEQVLAELEAALGLAEPTFE